MSEIDQVEMMNAAENKFPRGPAGMVEESHFATLVRDELDKARNGKRSYVRLGDGRIRELRDGGHPKLNSAHEGYAVILEELDEFKEEVWKKSALRNKVAMLKELAQCAAMCQRAAEDLGLI